MNQKKSREVCDVLLSNAQKIEVFNFKFLQKMLDETNKQFKGSSKIYQNSAANKIWMCYNLEKFSQKY